jgi:hypothetical protein
MNNVLVAIRRPKVYIPVVVLLVVIVAFLSLPKSNDADPGTAQNQLITKETAAKLDKQKIDSMSDMVTRIVSSYTKAGENYPLGTKSGWTNLINEVPLNNSFIDPYTKTTYAFVDKSTNPDFGQIQYYPGGACDTKSQTFKKGTFRTIALRARLFNTYHCVSTVEIQASAED